MYPVSENYITALRNNIHHLHMYGTIGNKSFSEEDFSNLTISRQCSGENQISIGSVYMAELHITFIHDLGISWQNVNGWAITLTESLEINALQTESVPGGVFYIAEVNITKDGIEVIAYDAMSNFDKKIRAGAVSTKNRTLPAMIEDICEECDVDLGNEDFDDFPNHTGVFTLASDNDCETYRDLISWIAQTMCAYAIVTSGHSLVFRMWKDAGTEDDVIDADNRADTYSFATYQTYYTGLSAVDTQRQQTKYYHEVYDTGLTYNLGANPFLQNLSSERFDAACENILSGLQNIYYVPFKVEILPTLAYDLGDIICFTGGQGYNDPIGCIMLYDYTFNQSIALEGLGQDPALASAKSKTDKDISGLLKKTEENKEYLYQFFNDDDIELSSTWKTIFNQRFATIADGFAIFQAEILCDDPIGSVTEVKYLLDGEEVSRYPIETWIEGKHILSLFYIIQTQGGQTYTWTVRMKSDAAVTIEEHDGMGSIRGQGLASTSAWNGYIDISETYELFDTIDDADLLTFTDSASVGTLTPIAQSITESYDLLDSVDDSTMVGYLDVYAFNQSFKNRMTWDESALQTWDASEAFYVWGIDTE